MAYILRRLFPSTAVSITSPITGNITRSSYNISLNAHRLFPDKCQIIKLYAPLTLELVQIALNRSISIDRKIKRQVLDSITNDDYFSQDHTLQKLSGILIHNSYQSIAMIESPNFQSDHILSIQVEDN